MEEKKHNVDTIFQKKLGDYTPSEPIGADIWDAINIKMAKKSFYRLSLSRFNIYYAAAIITCTTSTLFSLTERFFLHPTTNRITHKGIIEDTLHNKNNPQQGANQTTHTSIYSKGNAFGKKQQSMQPHSSFKDALIQVTDNNNTTQTKDTLISTQPQSVLPNPTTKGHPEQKEQVEVLYLYKRDTIFKYDTVTVKKKNRR